MLEDIIPIEVIPDQYSYCQSLHKLDKVKYNETVLSKYGHSCTQINLNTCIILFGVSSVPGAGKIFSNDAVIFTSLNYAIMILNNISKEIPTKRAAHAACKGELSTIFMYGGVGEYSSYASDDLWYMEIIQGVFCKWNRFKIGSKTPGERYGHTLNYINGKLYLYGGITRLDEVLNDLWVLDIKVNATGYASNIKMYWVKVDYHFNNNQFNSHRSYHTSLFAFNKLFILGGRNYSKREVLIKQIDFNIMFSIDVSSKEANEAQFEDLGRCDELERQFLTAHHFGPFLFIIGGSSNLSSEPLDTLNAYSFVEVKWYPLGRLSIQRHASFLYVNIDENIKQVSLILFGGIDRSSKTLLVGKSIKGKPKSIGSGTILKIDLLEVIERNNPEFDCMMKEYLSQKKVPLDSNDIIALKNELSNSKKYENYKMSSRIIAAQLESKVLSSDSKNPNEGDDDQQVDSRKQSRDMCKQISIYKLSNEGKRLLSQPPSELVHRNYDEGKVENYLQALLPFEGASDQDITIDLHDLYILIHYLNVEKPHLKSMNIKSYVTRIRYPIKIYSNLKGDFQNLANFFTFFGKPSQLQGDIDSFDYLFMGDLFESKLSLQDNLKMLCLLTCLLIKYPDNITVLRGSKKNVNFPMPHAKSEEYTELQADEISINDQLSLEIQTFLENLPLVAIINDQICCVHSGIPSSLVNFTEDDILRKKPINSNLLSNLSSLGMDPSKFYTAHDVKIFLLLNQFNLIIRAEESDLNRSLNKMFNETLISFTTSSNRNHDGSLIIIKKNGEMQLKLINTREIELKRTNSLGLAMNKSHSQIFSDLASARHSCSPTFHRNNSMID